MNTFLNPEAMLLLFRFAGLVMLGLLVANMVAPKRLNYASSLRKADLIVRQIFYVHCAYIILVIAGLTLLCLGWPQLLLGGELARGLCGFFAFFWLSRVVTQLSYYDKRLRAQERGWDLFFLVVFAFLGGVFLMGVL